MLTRRFRVPALAMLLIGGPAAGAGKDLDARDFAARQEHRLLSRDADGDGRVDRAEFVGGAGRSGGDRAARFAALDRHGNRALDRAEIAAVAARRFARLDKDRGGLLTAVERVGRRRRARATAGAAPTP